MRTKAQTKTAFLSATAFTAMLIGMGAGPALAANVIRIDISGTGAVTSLAIVQDTTNNSNIISTTGLAGGASVPVRGKWASLSVTQNGADNVLKGTGLRATAGSTTASLTAVYGADATTGNNVHSLSIGGTTTPANPVVTIDVSNSDAENAANTITDVLDGAGLTYDLVVDGTDNTIANTIAATGAVTLDLAVNGGILGSGNTVTNTITGATSASVTVAVNSDGNSITNLSNGSGDKVISVSLPVGGADGNTVSNDFTGGSGAQTSTLSVTGATSRVNFGLTASGAGTVSNVNLADVVGAAGAAGKLTLSQTGAGTNLALTVNGGGFTMGSALAGGAGVLIAQVSPGALLDAVITAGANGYGYTITQ